MRRKKNEARNVRCKKSEARKVGYKVGREKWCDISGARNLRCETKWGKDKSRARKVGGEKCGEKNGA